MSDDERSPGVCPLAWVTLGLLVLSGYLAVCVAIQLFAANPLAERIAVRIAGSLFVMVAHVVCGLLAWNGSGFPRLQAFVLVAALVYAGLAVIFYLLNFFPLIARDWGLHDGMVVGTYAAWIVGWVVGIPALIQVMRPKRDVPHSDNE